MATALDWENRFIEHGRLVPHDERGTWRLIAECLEDDDALTHTFNAVLKKHHAPHRWVDDLHQEIALSLSRCIRNCPDLNLHHRWHGVTAAGWFHRVIDKLCIAALRARWREHRRQVRLQAVLSDGRRATLADSHVDSSDELFHAARLAQSSRANAWDAAMDVNAALTACDTPAAAAIRIYVKDWRVQSVADELGCSYMRAWRLVQRSLGELREPLCSYCDLTAPEAPL